MKKKKLFAGIVSAVMLCSALPAVNLAVPTDYSSVYAAETSEPQTTVVYSADFEDGTNDFTGRDGIGTFNVVSTDAHGGTNCLECSDRTKGWHGPQLLLDNMLEPGVEYIASAWVKAAWYNDVKMSMEYTDSEGTAATNYVFEVSKIAANMALILVSSIMLVDATNNPFLYFRF